MRSNVLLHTTETRHWTESKIIYSYISLNIHHNEKVIQMKAINVNEIICYVTLRYVMLCTNFS
jgi:hypothetical protein